MIRIPGLSAWPKTQKLFYDGMPQSRGVIAVGYIFEGRASGVNRVTRQCVTETTNAQEAWRRRAVFRDE